MCGCSGAGELSATPVASSACVGDLGQDFPPSVVLKSPRGSLGTALPKAPAITTSGFVGSTIIELMKCSSTIPALLHVAPASVDLKTPRPLPCSPVAT